MEPRSTSLSPEAEGPSPDAVLKAFAQASDDAMLSLDRRGRITSSNHAAERFFGYGASEILGNSSADLFPEHVRADVERVFAQVAAGDWVYHFETEILRKDGMPMPISLSMCPVYEDDHDRPVASIVIARDITEQRLTQATLAEIEARVRESEALAHVGSWLWDVRTGVVQWSDEFHRIHGIDPLDFDGTVEAHLASIHPEDRDRVHAKLEAAVASGKPFEDEYRVVRPDQEVRYIRARAQPTVGSAGTVAGLRGIGQDVSDRHLRVSPGGEGA
jgi:PAS domain S-box-containing protein